MESVSQGRLFFESIEEALDHVVQVMGGRKKTAGRLWPHKPIREAHNHLDACLNPERRERLAPHEVLLLLRWAHDAECHEAMSYLAGEAGYSAAPVDPKDEVASLQREFIAAAKRQEQIVARIERLSTPPLSSVKTGT